LQESPAAAAPVLVMSSSAHPAAEVCHPTDASSPPGGNREGMGGESGIIWYFVRVVLVRWD